ncbi:hypothetical protein ILYODFUR_016449 [Ilyodon furcidens]|uniref:Transducer of regulated CREB activity N-terminal domain-containing protein n=1 Tax=Ilyodon furcidens TaxID=33524 RepID=A0ABV0TJ59_9TELE
MLNNLSLMTLVLRRILRVRPLSPPTLSAGNHSTTSGRPVRSVKMSATGLGGPGPGPGPATGSGSGASNPRKFSEKIALHTQRQAEETAAFQEVMMDITSTRCRAKVSIHLEPVAWSVWGPFMFRHFYSVSPNKIQSDSLSSEVIQSVTRVQLQEETQKSCFPQAA